MNKNEAAALWLIATLALGAYIAVKKPILLIPWLIPGVPPPGPFG